MGSANMGEPWIEHDLGPFGPAALKPYSETRRATDGSAFLKVYVGVDPEGRLSARGRDDQARHPTGNPGSTRPGHGEG